MNRWVIHIGVCKSPTMGGISLELKELLPPIFIYQDMLHPTTQINHLELDCAARFVENDH